MATTWQARPGITHLLWTDLETTDTDPARDEILEVGAVLTTTGLAELDHYQDIIVPTLAGQRRINENGIVSRMHAASGLAAVLDAAIGHAGQQTPERYARAVSVVEATLVAMLDDNDVPPGEAALAGSGVGHLDRAFIGHHLPRLASRLTYWTLDIGPVRRALGLWAPRRIPSGNDAKTHRAMDDVRCHLADACVLRDLLGTLA